MLLAVAFPPSTEGVAGPETALRTVTVFGTPHAVAKEDSLGANTAAFPIPSGFLNNQVYPIVSKREGPRYWAVVSLDVDPRRAVTGGMLLQ